MYQHATIFALLGIELPAILPVRNNVKCVFVPETTDLMYNVFQDIARDSDSETIKHFADELDHSIKKYQGDCFCVPVYLPTQDYACKLSCGERPHTTNYHKTAWAWNKRANEKGFELGNYYQFVLWMATIVSYYSEACHVSIGEALESVLKPVEELNDKQWTRRIMWAEDGNNKNAAVVTGFDPDRYGMDCGTMIDAQKIYYNQDVTATPFITARYY